MLTGLGLLLLLFQVPRQVSARTGPKMANALETALKTRVKNYHVAGSNFVDALLDVAAEHKIPMGIAWVRRPAALKRVTIFGKDGTVRDVIQDLVSTQPGYKMTQKGGLVHIFATGTAPDQENFLNLKVSNFEVQNQVAELAERQLAEIVQAHMRPPKPPAAGNETGGVGHSLGVEVGDPELTLRFREATVEEVLDALTLASGRGVWLVTFAPSGDLTTTGFRRVASPVADEANPQLRAPYWELLRWGRKPY